MSLIFKSIIIFLLLSDIQASWFWFPSHAAKDEISEILKSNRITYDKNETLSLKALLSYCDKHKLNELDIIDENDPYKLMDLAWKSIENKNYNKAILYSTQCITLLKDIADKDQAYLLDKRNTSHKQHYPELGAVGVSYFIIGESFNYMGQYPLSIKAYNTCIKNYPYAQTWEP